VTCHKQHPAAGATLIAGFAAHAPSLHKPASASPPLTRLPLFFPSTTSLLQESIDLDRHSYQTHHFKLIHHSPTNPNSSKWLPRLHPRYFSSNFATFARNSAFHTSASRLTRFSSRPLPPLARPQLARLPPPRRRRLARRLPLPPVTRRSAPRPARRPTPPTSTKVCHP
jgi:hypothetical protein